MGSRRLLILLLHVEVFNRTHWTHYGFSFPPKTQRGHLVEITPTSNEEDGKKDQDFISMVLDNYRGPSYRETDFRCEDRTVGSKRTWVFQSNLLNNVYWKR